MFKYVIWGIAIYLLIRFIFNFIIPVWKATHRMRDQVKEFQERMNQPSDFRSGMNHPQKQQKSPEKAGDYIDFEEIR